MTTNWFDVSKDGLGKQAAEYGKGRLVGELIQNALDEEGVTKVTVEVERLPGKPQVWVTVEDDSPTGFADLTHAYTLFAKSCKRSNPEQRGQFNFGEKLVLSACYEATISTTTGTVKFDKDNGRRNYPKKKRESGSVFRGRMPMTKAELEDVRKYLHSLIVPESITVTLDGEPLQSKTPSHTFSATLQTPIEDEDGVMRLRMRKTDVSVFECEEDETPMLYEMGLPIVELGDRWHVSIGQKVPVNRDRNNVTPSYLRTLRTKLLDELHEELTSDDANQAWVRQATPNCSDAAIKKVLDLRFGENRASYDPSDIEANKKFVSNGGTIVHGSSLSKEEWRRAKDAGAIEPAGKLCPTPKAFSDDPNAPMPTVIPQQEWTTGMLQIVNYAKFLAERLLNEELEVTIYDIPNKFWAAYKRATPRQLMFNVQRLGFNWFERGITTDVDALLIHEFGHEFSGDHLSRKYYDGLCELGAKLKQLALEAPDELAKFSTKPEPTEAGKSSPVPEDLEFWEPPILPQREHCQKQFGSWDSPA